MARRKKNWFGSAGTSMKDSRFQEQFGRGNSKAGELGEIILEEYLRPLAGNKVTGFSSLKLPKSRGDVDLVLLCGSTVLLIDAKLWKTGKYRMKSGKLYRDGDVYDNNPSKNMDWARRQIQDYLGDGYNVIPVIVLVNFRKTGTNGKEIKSTKKVSVAAGTKFPGGVPLYNQSKGLRFIKFKIMMAKLSKAGFKDYHEQATAKLRKLVQEI